MHDINNSVLLPPNQINDMGCLKMTVLLPNFTSKLVKIIYYFGPFKHCRYAMNIISSLYIV